MNFRILFFALLACVVEATAAPALAPAAASCVECHGSDGAALNAGTPHLNGQIEAYITDSLAAFKDGSRPSSVEAHNNASFTDKDVAAIAKFYAEQKKARRTPQPFDPVRVAAAAETYKQRCAKCHLDDGRDSDHDAPLMAGQALDYLQAQTEAYVSGKRKFPFMMDDAYRGLKREDLVNLSHYFAAAKPQ